MDEIAIVPLIQVLVGRLKSLVGDRYHMQIMSDTLVKDLEYVASTIVNAEVNQTDYATKLSLRNLQDLVFDVDDLVDKLQIRYARGLLGKTLSNLLPTWTVLVLHHEFQAIVGTLDEIKRKLTYVPSINNKNTSGSGATIPDSVWRRPHAACRVKERGELRSLVLGGEVSVISIVGPMGIGKTTLAQCIFADESVLQCFERRIWVGVGRGCDNVSIWGADSRDIQHFSHARAKMELGRMFEGRKVLLVLDDCWDKALCESLLRSIPDLAYERSVILVTTHSRSLASALGAGRAHVYQLEWLSSEASYAMLTDTVSGSANFQNAHGFETALKQIAELCRGVPSILSEVGDILHTGGPLEVERVLARLEEGRFDEITEKFSLCYDVLPSHLKLPFQTLFLQKACGLSVEALTCLWMALGFLYPPDSYQHSATRALTQLLDVGREYLREFAESDLSPKAEYAPGGVMRDIHMDDHIYSLSLLRARNDNWVMIHDTSSQKIDKTARYIIWDEDSLQRNAVPSDLLSARKARLFILHTKERAPAELVRGIIRAFKCLRVLGLGGCDIEMFPDSIGYLEHLRYLDLGRNPKLRRLPNSIFRLWYLQTLFLHGCERLEKIPASIGRLKNLVYLTLTTLQKSLPEEIGQLMCLQTLGLAGCQNLASLPRSIKDFKCLRTLAIVDCPELNLAADSSVEGLKGNESIETLVLRNLPKFAGFLSDLGAFCVAMKHLVIQSCGLFRETMWIKLLKPLRSLTIEGCPELSVIMDGTAQFNSLLELVIRNCSNLSNTVWIRQFMSLRSLVINGCPNLMDLDAGFSELKSLQRLEIKECPVLSERCARLGEDWHLIGHVPLIELDGENA